MRIKFHENVGTSFVMSFGQMDYIVTAGHLVKGCVRGDRVAFFFKEEWVYIVVDNITFCPEGSDVAVLSCAELDPVLKNLRLFGEEDMDGAQVGEDVAYCGYPLGLYTAFGYEPWKNTFALPFVKKGCISGFHPNIWTIYIDSINNKGFSGGPVIVNHGIMTKDSLKIVGVTVGYMFDSPSLLRSRTEGGGYSETPDYHVRPNSGFMKAIMISRVQKCAETLATL